VIEEIEIRNWQSLRHVKLTLGRLTVVVGASSSGKTALMRALRGLASNVRGTQALTRGAASAHITARTGEHVVSLEHSKGCWFYRVTGPDGENDYTKLAGSVPTEVTAILGIAPVTDTSLNFAGQFDKPFLVDEPGSKVARVLGELTNVDVLLGAVAEANRVCKASAATLRVREADLAYARTQLAGYAGLSAQQEAYERAELIHLTARDLTCRVDRLVELIDRLDTAEEALARQPVPPVPDTAALDEAHDRYRRFVDLLHRHVSLTGRLEGMALQLRRADEDITGLELELTRQLAEAGVCPTCGQAL
jgi:energy-coupling factor transporter ATP-binding protein EcfA2